MVSLNAGAASAFTYHKNKAFRLRLESDVHFIRTRTGLAPPPARCNFPDQATVFVNVFLI